MAFDDAKPLGGFLIVSVVVVAWVKIFFFPDPPLPANTANGTYVNPCCRALTLKDGHGQSVDVSFDYKVEEGKNGPNLLLEEHRLFVDGNHLVLTESRAGQYLPTDRLKPPGSLDVEGVEFVRRSETSFR